MVVTLSRSLHKFRWCWGGATASSHTNPPTLTHALQYRTEWSLRIICLRVAETNSGQFWGMKWCIPGMHLNLRSPVLESTHDNYMTEILSQSFARLTESWVCTEEKYNCVLQSVSKTAWMKEYHVSSLHSIIWSNVLLSSMSRDLGRGHSFGKNLGFLTAAKSRNFHNLKYSPSNPFLPGGRQRNLKSRGKLSGTTYVTGRCSVGVHYFSEMDSYIVCIA